MSARASYFKIGLFVISGAAIAVAAVIVLGAGTLFRETILTETYFKKSVQGLDVGAPVKFRGVQVGKVREITLVNQEYDTDRRYVLVRMALYPEATPVKIEKGEVKGPAAVRRRIERETEQGFRIRLAFQGLTGTAYLEADYLDPALYPPFEIDWEPRYPYCASAPSMITRLSEAVDRIMRDVEQIEFQGIAEGLNRSLTALTNAIEDANVKGLSGEGIRLLGEVRQTNRRIGELLAGDEIRRVLDDISATAASLRRTAEGVEEPVTAVVDDLPEFSERAGSLARRLDAASEDITEILARLKRVSYRLDDLVAGQQANIERTLGNMKVISQNLREFSETVKRDPSRLLFGKPDASSKQTR
jgi:phospholipid/cholesterol/gamma-HCH transport system substrate-binding protein/paraquat-inducible protein B